MGGARLVLDGGLERETVQNGPTVRDAAWKSSISGVETAAAPPDRPGKMGAIMICEDDGERPSLSSPLPAQRVVCAPNGERRVGRCAGDLEEGPTHLVRPCNNCSSLAHSHVHADR
jgi:hypothetical protein